MAGFFRYIARACIGMAAFAAAVPAVAACQLGKYLELPVTMRGPRPIVSAQIGGKDLQLLLDSGAFFSMLSRAAAAQYGLRLGPLPTGLRVQGVVRGDADASLATVKNFGLGPATLPDVEFIVGGSEPGAGAAGLLGQNFLHIGDAEYDLPHGSVRLLKATGCKPGEYVYWAGPRPLAMVPLQQDTPGHATHTVGSVIVNGVKLNAIFDSGAASSIMTLAAAKRAGLTPTSPGVEFLDYAMGIGGGSTKAWIGTFASIDIGGEAIRNPKIAFADVQLGGDDLLIGADFFLTHRIYVSNKQQKMFITYEGGPVFGLKPTGAVTSSGQRIDLTDKSETPTDADGFARRAAVAASNGRTEDAIADFGKAIAIDPKKGLYYRQRAVARFANHQPLLAVGDIDKAIELDPDDAEARMMRAGLRVGAHDPDGALDDIRAADRALPAGAGQRLALAMLADRVDHPDLSILNLDAWMKTHPDDALRFQALNGRCWARAELNRELDAALADCNAALKLRPGNPALLDSRALVYLRQGNLRAALADYDASLKAQPRQAWSLYARGLVKTKLGDADGAKADREEAIRINAHVADRAHRFGLEG